jgi:alpha-L-fucosidase 2
MRLRHLLPLSLAIVLSWQASAELQDRVDWEKFLAGHDPLWNRMGKDWWEAPFVGDGELGMMVRLAGEKTLRFDVGSNRVHDHRTEDLWKGKVPDAIEVQNRGRLPIGRFELTTEGIIDPAKSTARIDLWNAEARGELVTDKGSVKWRIFTHATDRVGIIEVEPTGGETGKGLDFASEEAISPRESKLPADLRKERTPNPKPYRAGGAGRSGVVWDLAAGGQTVSTWRRTGNRLFWTVEHRFPEKDAAPLASARIAKAAESPFDEWQASHRAWWHQWYGKSFFSFSDPYWESFYWTQIYKMGSATRSDRGLIDNCGPWFQPSGWSATWWNLNVQLSYSPFYGSNRFHEAGALPAHLEKGMANLIASVDEKYREDSAGLARNTGPDLLGWSGQPGGRPIRERADIGMECGNLLWTCHNLYRHYRCSMDEKMGKELLFPLLKRAVNYHRHFLTEGKDGRLHLPKTHSPEYGEAEDANYDLALLTWGSKTLLELDLALGMKDPQAPGWQRILEKLTPFPRDKKSYFIGAGMPYEKSHRHWSHLLMIYPLGLVTPEKDGADWIKSNLDHWHSKPGALQGYSFTGGIAMSAILGDGERTQKLLDGFRPFLKPNTLYLEAGTAPVMETPLHCATVLQEMAMRSQNGEIHLFPALSPKWGKTIFRDFTAEGGFRVSAASSESKTRWVVLTSPFVGEVILRAKGITALKREAENVSVEELGEDRLKLRCQAGGRMELFDGTTVIVEPAGKTGENPFGLK